MAACESCKTGGYETSQMHASDDGAMLLGPCCQPKQLPASEVEIDWGVALSSKRGLEVFASYGDLKLTYQKSTQDLKEMVDRIQ